MQYARKSTTEILIHFGGNISVPDGGLLNKLTERQRECILLVKDGKTSKEIGRELDISHRTVELHVAGALERLGVHNRYAAIALLNGDAAANDRPEVPIMPRDLDGSDSPHVESPKPFRSEQVQIRPRPRQPFPPLGGSRNTAGRAQRLRWILSITVAGTAASSLVILSITALVGLLELL